MKLAFSLPISSARIRAENAVEVTNWECGKQQEEVTVGWGKVRMRILNIHIGELFVMLMIQLQDFVKDLISSYILLQCFSASSAALYEKCSLKNTFSIHTPVCLKEEFEICSIVRYGICLQIFLSFLLSCIF